MGNSKMILSRLSILFVGFCSMPGMAAVDYLDMDLAQLLQVNVTGVTLRDESLKTVPSVVTVFTRQQLDALGLEYLFELMRLVPGFQVTRVGDTQANYTFSAAGHRGGSRSREVALVVDGRIFVDPRSAGADSAFPLFPLANIERIEIIQGPGSAIYGSGAFTGLINIVSRRDGRQLNLSVGSDERRKADLQWNYTAGNWQLNAFGYAYEDRGDTYYLANGGITGDPRRELALDLGIQYGQTRMQLAWFTLRAQDFYALERVRNGFNEFQPEYRHLSFEHSLNLTSAWNAKFSYHFQDSHQDLDGVLSAEGALAAISQPSSTEPLLSNIYFHSRSNKWAMANDLILSDKGSLQFGVEWLRVKGFDGDAYTNFDLGQLANGQLPINYYGNLAQSTVIESATQRDTSGAYTQWLQELGADTRLTLGVRYDYYEAIGSHLSPRVGVVHQLDEHNSVKLLYGDAFRAPSFPETHLTNNPFLRGNPNLGHELVKTWNLVWVSMWQKSSFNLATFHNQYEDPIITGFNEAGVRTYINSDDRNSQGASIDIKQQLGESWLMRLSLTRFIDLPDSAFAEADRLAAYILNYHKGAWNWNISFNYQGEREYLRSASQREKLSAYWLANSHLSYQLTSDTRVSLTIKNLMDEDYASSPQGAGVIGGVPNRGREWGLGVDWRW